MFDWINSSQLHVFMLQLLDFISFTSLQNSEPQLCIIDWSESHLKREIVISWYLKKVNIIKVIRDPGSDNILIKIILNKGNIAYKWSGNEQLPVKALKNAINPPPLLFLYFLILSYRNVWLKNNRNE